MDPLGCNYYYLFWIARIPEAQTPVWRLYLYQQQAHNKA